MFWPFLRYSCKRLPGNYRNSCQNRIESVNRSAIVCSAVSSNSSIQTSVMGLYQKFQNIVSPITVQQSGHLFFLATCLRCLCMHFSLCYAFLVSFV
jgi:hypothetical protein